MREHLLTLRPQQIIALERGATQIRVPITAANSTVNGYDARADRPACEYGDGWVGLLWDEARKDGQPAKLEDGSINIFGAGVNEGHSCGEYLHVPVPPPHRGAYRVRSKIEPGDWATARPSNLKPGDPFKLEIRTFTAVRVQRLHDMTRADAAAEGLERDDYSRGCTEIWHTDFGEPSHRKYNPWTWVYEVQR